MVDLLHEHYLMMIMIMIMSMGLKHICELWPRASLLLISHVIHGHGEHCGMISTGENS
jgi:hypothetical protein